MNGFTRDIPAALSKRYDVIVVGGGIYGMMLTLETARRGFQPLLVERQDFGGAASLNSLRILHGGLRYLQNLDLKRFFESVEQRAWFMRHFAPFCRVLPCLMPLYGNGFKRPVVLRFALKLNDVLSRDASLADSRVISAEETIKRFPAVRRNDLQGGALWHDGQVLSPQRLHAELLRWAVRCGATVLNYTEAIALKREGRRVIGLATSVGDFAAPVVINAAGAWSRDVATKLDRDHPELMTPSLTFNVLLNVPSPSDGAVAVQGSRMYFVTPHQAGWTFAGTVHRAWNGITEPSEAMITEFLNDLGQAVPGWRLSRSNVMRITSGVLPAIGPGRADMAHRSSFVRHDMDGLFSVCGIKYTTAQSFAVRVVERIFGSKVTERNLPEIGNRAAFVNPAEIMALNDDALRQLATEESVTCAEDLLERRMDWIPDDDRSHFEARVTRLLNGSGQTNKLVSSPAHN